MVEVASCFFASWWGALPLSLVRGLCATPWALPPPGQVPAPWHLAHCVIGLLGHLEHRDWRSGERHAASEGVAMDQPMMGKCCSSTRTTRLSSPRLACNASALNGPRQWPRHVGNGLDLVILGRVCWRGPASGGRAAARCVHARSARCRCCSSGARAVRAARAESRAAC